MSKWHPLVYALRALLYVRHVKLQATDRLAKSAESQRLIASNITGISTIMLLCSSLCDELLLYMGQ